MIHLQYGNYSGTTLTWSATKSLNELSFTQLTETDRSSGRSLRGIEFSHNHSSRKIWKLVISADELIVQTSLDFIEAFYQADAWKFSHNQDSTQVEVVVQNSETIPFEFIDNNKKLVEVTLIFIQKNPD